MTVTIENGAVLATLQDLTALGMYESQTVEDPQLSEFWFTVANSTDLQNSDSLRISPNGQTWEPSLLAAYPLGRILITWSDPSVVLRNIRLLGVGSVSNTYLSGDVAIDFQGPRGYTRTMVSFSGHSGHTIEFHRTVEGTFLANWLDGNGEFLSNIVTISSAFPRYFPVNADGDITQDGAGNGSLWEFDLSEFPPNRNMIMSRADPVDYAGYTTRYYGFLFGSNAAAASPLRFKTSSNPYRPAYIFFQADNEERVFFKVHGGNEWFTMAFDAETHTWFLNRESTGDDLSPIAAAVPFAQEGGTNFGTAAPSAMAATLQAVVAGWGVDLAAVRACMGPDALVLGGSLPLQVALGESWDSDADFFSRSPTASAALKAAFQQAGWTITTPTIDPENGGIADWSPVNPNADSQVTVDGSGNFQLLKWGDGGLIAGPVPEPNMFNRATGFYQSLWNNAHAWVASPPQGSSARPVQCWFVNDSVLEYEDGGTLRTWLRNGADMTSTGCSWDGSELYVPYANLSLLPSGQRIAYLMETFQGYPQTQAKRSGRAQLRIIKYAQRGFSVRAPTAIGWEDFMDFSAGDFAGNVPMPMQLNTRITQPYVSVGESQDVVVEFTGASASSLVSVLGAPAVGFLMSVGQQALHDTVAVFGSKTFAWQVADSSSSAWVAVPDATQATWIPSNQHVGKMVRAVVTYVQTSDGEEVTATTPSVGPVAAASSQHGVQMRLWKLNDTVGVNSTFSDVGYWGPATAVWNSDALAPSASTLWQYRDTSIDPQNPRDNDIFFSWGAAWTGRLDVPSTASYYFYPSNGVRLSVDGVERISYDGSGSNIVTLHAGAHTIELARRSIGLTDNDMMVSDGVIYGRDPPTYTCTVAIEDGAASDLLPMLWPLGVPVITGAYAAPGDTLHSSVASLAEFAANGAPNYAYQWDAFLYGGFSPLQGQTGPSLVMDATLIATLRYYVRLRLGVTFATQRGGTVTTYGYLDPSRVGTRELLAVDQTNGWSGTYQIRPSFFPWQSGSNVFIRAPISYAWYSSTPGSDDLTKVELASGDDTWALQTYSSVWNQFLGKSVSVAITFTDSGGAPRTVMLRGSKSSFALLTGAKVAVYGSAEVGQLHQTRINAGYPFSTFQWQVADASDGSFADISDASSSDYTPPSELQGKFIRVVVDGENISEPIGPLTSTILDEGNSVGVQGTPTDGTLLTVDDSSLPSNSAISYVRWTVADSEYPEWALVVDANSRTWTPATAHVGKYVRVAVAYTDAEGQPRIRRSGWVGPILAATCMDLHGVHPEYWQYLAAAWFRMIVDYDPASLQAETAPSTPGNPVLVEGGASYSSLTVRWIASSGDVANYLVGYKQSAAAGGYTWVNTTSSKAVYTLRGLQPSVEYALVVAAVSRSGMRSESSVAQLYTTAFAPPAMPAAPTLESLARASAV